MKCPVCRAENGDDVTCRRCKCDLSMCQAVLREREGLFADTVSALREGRFEIASQLAERADRLLHDAESVRWLAATALMRRDFAAAWEIHHADAHGRKAVG